MKNIPSLGEQEMLILKFINENSPITVREVALQFEKSLARTTVLTVMERLRKKGFLKRSKSEGVFQYSSQIETQDVMRNKISEFVQKTLGGSMSPLVQYFLASTDLTETEMNQLKKLAEKLEKGENQ